MSRVTVIITSYEDDRIGRTLASLEMQERRPTEVLVTDGSRDPEARRRLRLLTEEYGAVWVHDTGSSVARARNLALDLASGDVLVFLDTDQWAPEHWLRTLVAPIETGEADWTGGPTEPVTELGLMELKEARLYAAAREDPTRIPMGNSAWRRHVFDVVGGFDEALHGGGEDWDLALRAREAGFKGQLVEEAQVWHDLSSLDSHLTVARKQFRYNVGGAMAYLKNRSLTRRMGSRYPRIRWHWFDLVEPVLKAAALPVAWWRLRKAPDRSHRVRR